MFENVKIYKKWFVKTKIPRRRAPKLATRTKALDVSFIFAMTGSILGSTLLHKSSIAVLIISAERTRVIEIKQNIFSTKEKSK